MEYSSFWGLNEDTNIEEERTHNILNIMDAQCEYLSQLTHQRVSAVFGEIKQEGPFSNITNVLSNSLNLMDGIPYNYEKVADRPIDELVDANSIYTEKKYGFEIFTDEYRFRLFELRMNPVYPVTIIIDEGICQNIAGKVNKIAIPQSKNNCYQIEDETNFCEVLKMILQDKKVGYIVNELQKSVMNDEKKDNSSDKVIICEGRIEEIFLQALAQKIGCNINIAVAEGKDKVPKVFSMVIKNNANAQILILVDSDGEPDATKEVIERAIGRDGYELAIVNDNIEDWFDLQLKGFNKLNLIKSIGGIVDKIDFTDYKNKYEAFAKIISFMEQ